MVPSEVLSDLWWFLLTTLLKLNFAGNDKFVFSFLKFMLVYTDIFPKSNQLQKVSDVFLIVSVLFSFTSPFLHSINCLLCVKAFVKNKDVTDG